MALDRAHVITTALRLLDDVGLDKLTLRRLATELDVRAPALYWHFENKRALLDHLADRILAPVLPEIEGPARAEDWPGWLANTANVLRKTLLRHPDGPRLALGANLGRAPALGMFVERTIVVLNGAGFTLTEAARAGGSFIWFVVGRTVEEQSMPELTPELLALTHEHFPTLSRAMTERHGETQDDAFAYSVKVFVDGLRAQVTER